MARHSLNIGEKFGYEIHQYHFQSILDTIECVDKGFEMNVRKFNKHPLKGLQHIHHNSNTFISHNIESYWKEKCGREEEVAFQNKLLEEIYIELLNEYPKEVAQEKAITVLLTKILYQSKFREQKKQTGEWIVFAQRENINYYLCLATHQEAKDFTDQVIFDRLEPCFTEFPELKR